MHRKYINGLFFITNGYLAFCKLFVFIKKGSVLTISYFNNSKNLIILFQIGDTS